MFKIWKNPPLQCENCFHRRMKCLNTSETALRYRMWEKGARNELLRMISIRALSNEELLRKSESPIVRGSWLSWIQPDLAFPNTRSRPNFWTLLLNEWTVSFVPRLEESFESYRKKWKEGISGGCNRLNPPWLPPTDKLRKLKRSMKSRNWDPNFAVASGYKTDWSITVDYCCNCDQCKYERRRSIPQCNKEGLTGTRSKRGDSLGFQYGST